MEYKEEGQEYAQVLRMLGNGRLEAMCFDGVKVRRVLYALLFVCAVALFNGCVFGCVVAV